MDGQELGIHSLKPGMKLERTTIVTTTPKTITTVKSVTGKVWHVSPPNSVILTLEDGTNQEFKIPKGQKFMVDGQETDAFGLKKGMIVSATKVVEEPITVVEQQRKLTGTMPPPPPAPPADVPILIAVGRTHACAERSGRTTQDCESPAPYRIAWHSCSLAFVRPESNSHHLLIHNGFEKPGVPAITRARLHFRPDDYWDRFSHRHLVRILRWWFARLRDQSIQNRCCRGHNLSW